MYAYTYTYVYTYIIYVYVCVPVHMWAIVFFVHFGGPASYPWTMKDAQTLESRALHEKLLTRRPAASKIEW